MEKSTIVGMSANHEFVVNFDILDNFDFLVVNIHFWPEFTFLVKVDQKVKGGWDRMNGLLYEIISSDYGSKIGYKYDKWARYICRQSELVVVWAKQSQVLLYRGVQTG